MEALSVIEERLKQPLSDTSSKAKKNLLLSSLLGFAITELGLMPSQISLLGISLEQGNQSALILLILLLVLYTFITFIVSMTADLLSWKVIFLIKREEMLLSIKDFDISHLDKETAIKHLRTERKLINQTKFVFLTRIFIDVVIPVSFAIWVLYLLATSTEI